LREKALNRTDEVKNKYSPRGWATPDQGVRGAAPRGLASSKPVTAYHKDGTVFMKLTGIRIIAKYFGCDHKTINKFIDTDKLFKNE